MYTIILSEEDKQFKTFLKQLLQLNGYEVISVVHTERLLSKVMSKEPQLVILDGRMYHPNTESICHEIKRILPHAKVIVLGNRQTNGNADDYISRPFTPEVFLARVNARLREEEDHQSQIIYEKITLDRDNFLAIRGNKNILLTPKEYSLLAYLMTNPNRVLTREMILNRVWTYAPTAETRVVDIFISFLRDKIDKGFKRKYIHSVRGFGYKFS